MTGALRDARPRPGSRGAIKAEIQQIADDPAASHWLRDALRSAVRRDPLDAAEDARILQELLDLRLNAILLAAGWLPDEV